MGLFTMLLARRKHRYGLLVSVPITRYTLFISPFSFFSDFSIVADESVRFRRGGVRVGVRARHRHDDGDTHVPAPRSSKMRLHGESEVSQINSSSTESIY